MKTDAEVLAAGAIVARAGSDDTDNSGDPVEILLIHRGRYDDWSFPKGFKPASSCCSMDSSTELFTVEICGPKWPSYK